MQGDRADHFDCCTVSHVTNQEPQGLKKVQFTTPTAKWVNLKDICVLRAVQRSRKIGT